MSQRPPTLNFGFKGLHPITAAREALFSSSYPRNSYLRSLSTTALVQNVTVLRIRSSLHRRPETSNLQYRKVIPEKLRPYFGKTEIKKTCKTADPSLARIRHHEISAKVEAQLTNAKAQLRGDIQIDEAQLHHMADHWFQSKLTELQKPESQTAAPCSLTAPDNAPCGAETDSSPRGIDAQPWRGSEL